MRRRAFVPEAPGSLEGRAVPSGGPVHLSGLGFDLTLNRVKGDFQQYSLSGNFTRLRTQLAQEAKSIPFGRVDGLGQQVNAILAQMETNIGAKMPGAINTAYQETVAGVRAEVIKHIDDGTVVVVK